MSSTFKHHHILKKCEPTQFVIRSSLQEKSMALCHKANSTFNMFLLVKKYLTLFRAAKSDNAVWSQYSYIRASLYSQWGGGSTKMPTLGKYDHFG